ncbi:MAG: hypothetical protein ACOYI4_05340 [Christensenellales bacterium]|jgi:hypothetical protein
MSHCVLYDDRKCTQCGECEVCDQDANKICDNCCRCIQTQDDYKELVIDAVLLPEEELAFEDELSHALADDETGRS